MNEKKTIGRDISVEEFDRMFDDGEDISAYIDLSTAIRPTCSRKGSISTYRSGW